MCSRKNLAFVCFVCDSAETELHAEVINIVVPFNPFNPKLIMQILPTIQEEND